MVPAVSEHHATFVARGMSPATPIEAAVDIAVSAESVWSAIAEEGNLVRVHPFCASNEVEQWPGVGSRDHVRYYSGIHYEREFVSWDEGVGYVIEVGPPSGKAALARWWIDPAGSGRCRFGIEVTSFVRSDVSAEARARYETDVIRGALPSYLDGVVRGVAHYCETGTPVAKNQFGAHALYSP